MGETVWADRPDGGQVPFDPDNCERFPLRVDGWPKQYLYLHRKPGGAVLIYTEEQPAMRPGGNPYTRKFMYRHPCRVVTRGEADGLCRQAGKDFPSEWKRVELEAETNPSEWEVDRQIIETLRAVGHRLTTDELLTEMSNRGLDPSDSTVKKRLTVLVKDRRLTNDPKARPRGYGLPEWHGSFGS
jgi:hypothetical protein